MASAIDLTDQTQLSFSKTFPKRLASVNRRLPRRILIAIQGKVPAVNTGHRERLDVGRL